MRNEQVGMTLIELIITIVVLGICVVSVLAMLSSLSMRSATAMTRTQASAVATAYLESILAQPYGAIVGYHNTDHNGAFDVVGNAIPGLSSYVVHIDAYGANLGTLPNQVPALRVDVTVTDPSGTRTLVTGYRTSFTGQVLY